MARTLTPAKMRQIRDECLADLNLASLSEEWRWRWVLLGSDEPLPRKFIGLVVSFFRYGPQGYGPSHEQIAAMCGLQPRQVINHLNALADKSGDTGGLLSEGFFVRTPGGGSGRTSSYRRKLPAKTLIELAERIGLTVQSSTPFDDNTVQSSTPITVQPSAPIDGKQCNPAHKTVQPSAHPFKDLKEKDSNCRTDAMNGHGHSAGGGAAKSASGKYDADFEAFWSAYRGAMQEAGGKALKNSRNMSKPAAAKEWQKLDMFRRDGATRFIRAHAEDAGEYMCAAGRYLSDAIFQNHADETADTQRRTYDNDVEILARHRVGTIEWSQGMTDRFVAPAGTDRCIAPPQVQQAAIARAAQMMEPTDA